MLKTLLLSRTSSSQRRHHIFRDGPVLTYLLRPLRCRLVVVAIVSSGLPISSIFHWLKVSLSVVAYFGSDSTWSFLIFQPIYFRQKMTFSSYTPYNHHVIYGYIVQRIYRNYSNLRYYFLRKCNDLFFVCRSSFRGECVFSENVNLRSHLQKKYGPLSPYIAPSTNHWSRLADCRWERPS